MLQRLQTLYLLGMIICQIATFIFPVLRPIPEGMTGKLLFVFPAAIFFLSAVIIFLYKKRKLQIFLCWINNILIAVFCGIAFYLFRQTETNIVFSMILPFAALVLNLLAIHRIRKDEALIRSLNRLR
ncbi:MAG: DUF4293 domain-containing protein [Bacteroidales bacterium]|jgi:hypothetical protein|nr:DUF4293 domain-containing protein [Bacteroidales bacterium]